ncbi:MAG: galactokinase [Defluviitaleaceae bacterium]|nr:galactokinase [Defluviitaleaceae bacterium]
MEQSVICEGFRSAFGGGCENLRYFFAPGRVNLIGEHTDYNGGYVFPCALDLGIYGAARENGLGVARLSSGNAGPKTETPLESPIKKLGHSWVNYPMGVVRELQGAGHAINGFDLYCCGDLPRSAGLSSSAAIELLTCVALDSLFSLNIDPVERARLCQRAENGFVGVNCGIMDQFASAMCREGQAVLLDCATLKHEFVPLELGDSTLVITNTNKPRGLAGSKYNDRRAECELALGSLKKAVEIESLCELTPTEFTRHKNMITDPAALKRAEHAVFENARTLKASEALKRNDLQGFGMLMNESHISLRDLYEVTGVELDALVSAAWAAEGVLGSRMTGAGFGGCTVSVVENDAVGEFIKTVGRAYAGRTGLKADFFAVKTGGGAREIYLND